MEVSYKRDMNHTYLILQGGEKWIPQHTLCV